MIRTILVSALLIYISIGVFGASASSESRFYCPTDGLRVMPKFPDGFTLNDSKGGLCLRCTTTALQHQEIRDNCVISQSKETDPSIIRTLKRACTRVACSPTLLEKWKYN